MVAEGKMQRKRIIGISAAVAGVAAATAGIIGYALRHRQGIEGAMPAEHSKMPSEHGE